MSKEGKNIKVLIVEDEIHAQKELKRLINNVAVDIEILDCLDSVEDTVQWIESNSEPDLMFFDIQLADGISFEIFTKTNVNTPVIFTTAYDEFAIKAFKVNSIDYLLKPVKQNELESAINKFRKQVSNKKPNEGIIDINKIEELLNINKPKFKSRFLSKIGDQIIHIGVEEISYFLSEDNITFIVTKDNKKHIIDHSLDNLTAMVNPELFFRINRSALATADSIKKINKYFNSRLHIELEPKTTSKQLISRVKVSDFLNWIDR